MNINFPEEFRFGTATASYQVEGGYNLDGKGESIWDRFANSPGHIEDGTTGEEACDFYNKYSDDLKLAGKLGIQVYRMSVSWPRIIPTGIGDINEKGIEFYRNVINEVHNNGMEVCLTIYHWDLPQTLQDKGGWANREIVQWFTDYANVLFSRLGDIVDYWITLNEPFCTAFLGYWSGEHAPGYHDYSMALQAVHNLLMAHGSAVKAYRKTGLKADIGITLNMSMNYPANPSDDDDVLAASRMIMQSNCLFGDPIYLGRYPQELFDYLKKQKVTLPLIYEDDMDLIHQKIDFFGLNNYSADFIKNNQNSWPLNAQHVKSGLPTTAANWEICPKGLYELLLWINNRYHPKKLIITENGAAENDHVNVNSKIEDFDRIDYLKRYLIEVKHAMSEGVPIKGYYIWCFTDNFEWAYGKSRRFGLVYVDYLSQRRIPKESAYWYSKLIKNRYFTV